MKYKELVDSGFKKSSSNCPVWFDEHGYKYFFLERDITEELSYLWYPATKKLELLFHKKGVIKTRREISDNEFLTIETVFNRVGDIPEPVNYNFLA